MALGLGLAAAFKLFNSSTFVTSESSPVVLYCSKGGQAEITFNNSWQHHEEQAVQRMNSKGFHRQSKGFEFRKLFCSRSFCWLVQESHGDWRTLWSRGRPSFRQRGQPDTG